jgi:hypothetical protein
MAFSVNKTNTINAYIAFLVWPLFSLVFSILNYRSTYSKNILWFFCAFFGFTFIISDPYMDANRYKTHLEKMYDKNDQSYVQLLKEPYTNKGIYSGTDIYSHLITTTVSRFTRDFRIFFAIIGLIYGYFYSRNLFYLIEKCKENKLIFLSILFIFTIALVIPFWNINGYRFYTAAHIFIFGVLRMIFEKKYRYAIFIVLSPLVHFSFVLPAVLFLIFLVLGNRIGIYLFALFISLFFVDLSPKTINENAELAPIFMQNKVKGYSAKDYVELVQKNQIGMNWYVKGHNYALQFCIYSMIIITFLKRKKFLVDKISLTLFSFGVLMFAMANIVSSIPSMDRFYLLAYILLLSAFIMIFQLFPKDILIKKLPVVYLIPIIIFATVEIRIGFDFLGLNSLFLNPFIAPFFTDSPALIEFIK